VTKRFAFQQPPEYRQRRCILRRSRQTVPCTREDRRHRMHGRLYGRAYGLLVSLLTTVTGDTVIAVRCYVYAVICRAVAGCLSVCHVRV